jgi:signal transduction histidine kinase/ActR/RegA family two-component response regulator
LDKTSYSEPFDTIWKKEHEIRSQWGHRVFCIAHIIGYPAASVLYYLNENPVFFAVLKIQLVASAVMAVFLFLNLRHSISNKRLAVYTFVTVVTFPHQSYQNASFNMTLALIFIAIVLRWPVKPAVICTILVFVFFPLSLYYLSPEALPQFIREGGFFFFLGHLLFPFVMHIKYTNEKRSFYFQYKLEEQNEKLEQQIKIAEEATRAKTDFLSMMSHEIRTPLNGIVGIVHLLNNEKPEAGFQKELFGTLLFSSNHLMTVVNDILDFNKINSNYVKLDSAPFDLVLLLRNLEKTFITKAKEKQLDLIFEVEDTLPARIIGDQGRLNQIITNLIHNAIKFTEKGNVRLVVREVDRNIDTISLHFKISDTGIGIPPAQQSAVFELFTQVYDSNERQYGGTGLGLAITKELLRLFNSKIELESEPGKGSAFSFSITFVYSGEAPQTEEVPVKPMSSYAHAKVLVVDDNSTNLLLATTFLKRKEIRYETAANGKEALTLFETNDFHLILMDLRMPVMDGFECTGLIRKKGSAIPIIALTASAFEDEKEKALSLGFDGYLTKPFLPDDLYQTIFPYLDRTARETP